MGTKYEICGIIDSLSQVLAQDRTHLEHYLDEFWLIILAEFSENEFAHILEIDDTLLFNL